MTRDWLPRRAVRSPVATGVGQYGDRGCCGRTGPWQRVWMASPSPILPCGIWDAPRAPTRSIPTRPNTNASGHVPGPSPTTTPQNQRSAETDVHPDHGVGCGWSWSRPRRRCRPVGRPTGAGRVRSCCGPCSLRALAASISVSAILGTAVIFPAQGWRFPGLKARPGGTGHRCRPTRPRHRSVVSSSCPPKRRCRNRNRCAGTCPGAGAPSDRCGS
ncbi:MAG: hypothetical protein QG608_3756 [Actinomycetota bacterium]|nr:hypothetical protein [Actinomycetota bacterium]